MPDIYDWSTTANDNDDADSTINWAEGQAPGTVNGSARNMMKRTKEFLNDYGAVGTVAGTDTITCTSAIAALATGKRLSFVAANTNTGAATLNVNSLGAKAIRKISGGSDVALSAGDIAAGETYTVIYRATANSGAGAWVLVGAAAVAAATTSAAGIVELATAAEALAASSSSLALTPASIASLIQNINNNAFKIADLEGVRLNMVGGIADAYDSETDVDTATSTNESYDSGNDLYSPSTSAGSMISQGTGSQITNFGTQASAMFDGTTNQASNNCSIRTGSPTSAYGGKNYSASPQSIGSVKVYGSNDEGYINGAAPSVTITLYGKNGGAPSGGTDGTSLGSITFSDTANESTGRTITSSDTTTAWDYVWVNIVPASGTANILLGELEIYQPNTINNMTLVSNAFTASAVPTTARMTVFIDPQVSITINTDFTAEVSRDGGTTYTAVTLALVSNPVGTVEQYEGTVSISSQPSGSSMKYRLKTLNNKDIDVTGTVFQWG